ncbi:MAG: protoporphyrinogen oxidase [Ignavibacteriales bacterium]|nr:protoporphyrinogen oxidase [Ignavibacteriales bacterium]
MSKKIIIFGAGISGLAAAYWLHKDGYDVTVLDKNSEAGGAMISREENGYLVDYGPNSGLETTPLIRQIVDAVGLSDEIIYANEEGNKRYILREDVLHPLPMNPPAFLKSRLFSTKAKLRLFAEPFIGRSEDGYYQSISQFVKRRLGQEFLDYAINPFVAGVYAGNPDELSVKSAFPKLYRLEEVYGGLIKGMIKGAKERKERAEQSKQNARMFSFKSGMQVLPLAIAKKLDGKVFLNASITKLEKLEKGYGVSYLQNGENKNINADIIVSAIPSHIAGPLFENMDGTLSNHLKAVYYPPVMVLFLGYKKEDVGQALDGFGFLIPQKEKKAYLGAIWSSVIFPNRSVNGNACFTIFVGGARSPELFDLQKDILIGQVLDEFQSIMRIKEKPIFITDRMWEKAIPQYNIGYIEHEKYFDQFEKANPGIILSGNYRGGISVGDCVKNSEVVYNKVKNLLT